MLNYESESRKTSIKKVVTLAVVLMLAFPSFAQTYTVSGYVSDHTTGEILIGASTVNLTSGNGTTSNNYGFYSLTIPKGNITLRYSQMGYEAHELGFELLRDTTINIPLTPIALEVEKIVVSAHDDNIRNSISGQVYVPISAIRNTPSLLGESDLMKSLNYIPGVNSSTEGKADLSVRGGAPDGNLILLDGNPIYNANHLFGFVSVFNTDALKNVTFYKSGFPARFGGRLSSVIDINTKDGNKERFGGSATLGLLAQSSISRGRLSKTGLRLLSQPADPGQISLWAHYKNRRRL